MGGSGQVGERGTRLDGVEASGDWIGRLICAANLGYFLNHQNTEIYFPLKKETQILQIAAVLFSFYSYLYGKMHLFYPPTHPLFSFFLKFVLTISYKWMVVSVLIFEFLMTTSSS